MGETKDIVMRILALLFALLAAPVWAHEFWIEPLNYQVSADGRLAGHIVNGQEFEGTNLPYIPQRFDHFVAYAGGTTSKVEGRIGNSPALDRDPVAEGLNVVAYQARYSTVDYETWEKFQKFVDHKDFGDILSQHQARGLPMADFKEIYARFSKTLIGVGNAAGADSRIGMETEILALTNPYTENLSNGVRVQVFYKTDPRPNTQVEVFEKSPNGVVSIELYRTDNNGIATIPVKSGHSYMVDAVVLREPAAGLAAQSGAVWETLWANLTFMAP